MFDHSVQPKDAAMRCEASVRTHEDTEDSVGGLGQEGAKDRLMEEVPSAEARMKKEIGQ